MGRPTHRQLGGDLLAEAKLQPVEPGAQLAVLLLGALLGGERLADEHGGRLGGGGGLAAGGGWLCAQLGIRGQAACQGEARPAGERNEQEELHIAGT